MTVLSHPVCYRKPMDRVRDSSQRDEPDAFDGHVRIPWEAWVGDRAAVPGLRSAHGVKIYAPGKGRGEANCVPGLWEKIRGIAARLLRNQNLFIG
jgi:hypothetical protein